MKVNTADCTENTYVQNSNKLQCVYMYMYDVTQVYRHMENTEQKTSDFSI
jgi:hypothetical protein